MFTVMAPEVGAGVGAGPNMYAAPAPTSRKSLSTATL